MVTDTRTTIRTDRITATDRTDSDKASQTAMWVILAIVAFAALGYAFYHYSNPVANPAANGSNSSSTSSMDKTPAANDNSNAAPTTNGAVMNNDTSTAPNTGTPAATPAPSDAPATAGTSNSTNGQ